jgi:hypothetical protein
MPWRAMEFIFVFAMWTVMMVGMMTPSAAPMILMYARVGRQIQAHGRPLAATVWFATGYSLSGSLSHCSPRSCNGRLSVPCCSKWQPRAPWSEASCSWRRAAISGPGSRTHALLNARSRLRS